MLLNILADEIHRAHQRCLQEAACDPDQKVMDLVFEAAASTMRLLKGAYSCLALIKGWASLRSETPTASGAAP